MAAKPVSSGDDKMQFPAPGSYTVTLARSLSRFGDGAGAGPDWKELGAQGDGRDPRAGALEAQ